MSVVEIFELIRNRITKFGDELFILREKYKIIDKSRILEIESFVESKPSFDAIKEFVQNSSLSEVFYLAEYYRILFDNFSFKL